MANEKNTKKINNNKYSNKNKFKKLDDSKIKKKEHVIILEDVSKSFGKETILKDVNLKIPANKIFGIIGVSGGGKTTLLNLLIGYLDYDDGLIEVSKDAINKSDSKIDYFELSKYSKKVKTNFGFASQIPSVYPELTVLENLRYFGRIQKLSSKTTEENLNVLLKFTQLEKHKHLLAKELSGGMLKRLDIACGIIHKPKVLLLDEPTSNLDPIARSSIWDLIKKINATGTTIIISSHFIDELDTLCDNVAVLHNGTITSQGSPIHLKDIYGKNDVIKLETVNANYSKIFSDIKSKDKNAVCQTEFGKAIIYSKKAGTLINDILRVITKNNDLLLTLELNKPSLKEIFESLENNDVKSK